MAVFITKQGDLEPKIRSELSYDDGSLIGDMTGATVVFVYQPQAGGAVTRRNATVVSFTDYKITVEYQFVAGDVSSANHYNAEWEVTRSNGAIITFPKDGYIQFIVNPDLR